jgi:nucleoside 2-deoxyribosyltransferase
MRVYISGKITGLDLHDAFAKFARMESNLRMFAHEPINPMKLPHDHDKSWHSYMREDIKALCDCDAILMLNDWADSRGAIVEHSLAMMLGIPVYFQTQEGRVPSVLWGGPLMHVGANPVHP